MESRLSAAFLSLLVVFGLVVFFLFATRSAPNPEVPVVTSHFISEPGNQLIEEEDLLVGEDFSKEVFDFDDPGVFVAQIAQELEKGNLDLASRMIGMDTLSDAQLKGLHEMAQKSKFRLQQNAVTEVGELQVNKAGRWALNLADEESGRVLLDLKEVNGKWIVERVILPDAENEDSSALAEFKDPLGYADAFLRKALKQDFLAACRYVDGSKVSNAKIAGMCIIFEEGHYRLRKKKPLRAMFHREEVAGFLASVENEDGSEVATFGLTLRHQQKEPEWLITEINLDALLVDYAKSVAGGDADYTPLIKNPKGGDTLVIYFDFDEDGLTRRTQRQLDIVVSLLKWDPVKKIVISGHTDSLGSDDYNKDLSVKRATTVKTYLVNNGVPEEQVITKASGANQPRLPNVTQTGQDNPVGRRANRRTEIYLNF